MSRAIVTWVTRGWVSGLGPCRPKLIPWDQRLASTCRSPGRGPRSSQQCFCETLTQLGFDHAIGDRNWRSEVRLYHLLNLREPLALVGLRKSFFLPQADRDG